MKRILIHGTLDNYAVHEAHIDYVSVTVETTEPYAHSIKIDVYGEKNETAQELEDAMSDLEMKEVSVYAIRDKFGNLTANLSDIAVLLPEWFGPYNSTLDEDQTVEFNADRRLGQNQYASRYASGKVGSHNLGEDLRWKNLDDGNYHSLRIHYDDLAEFHRRVEACKHATSWGHDNPLSFMEPVIRGHEVPLEVDES